MNNPPLLNVNLIPRKRRAARRLRSCCRAWAVFGVAYLIVVAGACAMVVSMTNPDDGPHQRSASGMAGQIAAAKDRLAQARAELSSLSRRLAAAHEVQGHPDWSVLLSLIAAERMNGVALASLELNPSGSATGGPRDSQSALADRPVAYSLHLSGLGKDHTQVAQFALRLEQMGLFSQVVLKDTTAKQIATRTVVSFGIECTLREAAGVAGAEK